MEKKVSSLPIGVFDSGIGGLTVAHAISKLIANENIVYFGDTAHLPYGDKSPDLIHSFVEDISKFLIQKESCKAVVIACNTASATSYEFLRDKHLGNVPIFNVIDPIIEAITEDSTIKKVGLIATKTTVESGVYQEKLNRRNPEISIEVLATPLLAPMIEEGFSQDKISNTVIENYLSNPKFKDIDALILGCTHYVLIADEISEFFNGEVKLFDSTDILAIKLKAILENESLLSEEKTQENKFYVSDLTKGFEESASRFYGEDLKLELKKLKR
ncbi:glutamate racemase [Flavobacteriales bacterium]|nr:glutamate racemase [Flavobacteriales bacterium]MDB4088840.1 glutamate racemase [Flavobacteriales bacterium]